MASQPLGFLERGGAFLTDRRFRKAHAVIIATALLVHLALHYALYVPALREPLGNLPYMRLHALHEAEFLLIVVYAALVFRFAGGLVAVAITAVTSIPFLLTPYIFGREPGPTELRDLATQVGFILVMGVIMSVLTEMAARLRELGLLVVTTTQQRDVAKQLATGKQLEITRALQQEGQQLQTLNRTLRDQINSLGQLVEGERVAVASGHSKASPEEYASFLQRLSETLRRRV
ncbi:MAG: hypothetical protein HY685_04035 [Chloroflexi bacterium]|nr:hypothetical protein [Chloroflexota bacterium]